MFSDLFKSVASIANTAVNVVATPVVIAADVVDVVTKPVGDAAKAIQKEVKQICN